MDGCKGENFTYCAVYLYAEKLEEINENFSAERSTNDIKSIYTIGWEFAIDCHHGITSVAEIKSDGEWKRWKKMFKHFQVQEGKKFHFEKLGDTSRTAKITQSNGGID